MKNPMNMACNEQQRSLILFGYKAVGKSYFGKLVAEELGIAFIDTDQLVEKLYSEKFRENLNCKRISLKVGEAGFRRLESNVIGSLGHSGSAVIAVGGGVVLNPENRMALGKLGKLIYLEADKEIIRQRIFKDGVPSFLDPDNLDASFERMYEGRKLIYESSALFRVDVRQKSNRQVLDNLKSIFYDI